MSTFARFVRSGGFGRSVPWVSAFIVMAACMYGCGSDIDRMHSAILRGDLASVKELVSKNPGILAQADQWGTQPLHWATQYRKSDIVKYLLSAGADPNVDRQPVGFPLHHAAYYGDIAMVKILIAGSADVNLQSDHKGSSSSGTPVHAAAYGARPKVLEYLISKGGDPDRREVIRNQLYPIQCAAAADPKSPGKQECLRILIRLGVEVNAKDAKGRTALWYARNSKDAEAVEYLLSVGAKD